MNRALFCLLSVVCLWHVSSASSPPPAPAPAASQSATALIEPLQEYLDMMAVNSVLTAQVYVVTSGGGLSWNNSMTYCQNTFSIVMSTTCYLAELLTPLQIKSVATALVNNNWNIWVGAYLKPLSHGQNEWIWYHTGYAINAPNQWQFGYPYALTSGGYYAGTVNAYQPWGAVLQNGYAPASALYFACTCY